VLAPFSARRATRGHFRGPTGWILRCSARDRLCPHGPQQTKRARLVPFLALLVEGQALRFRQSLWPVLEPRIPDETIAAWEVRVQRLLEPVNPPNPMWKKTLLEIERIRHEGARNDAKKD
jgi:hypothetical protein